MQNEPFQQNEKLLIAVNKVLKDHTSDLSQKIEKLVKKSDKKINKNQ